jgi:hypothetical protein
MVVKTSMIFRKKKKPFIRFYSIEAGVDVIHPVYPATQLKRPWMQCPVDNKEGSHLGETRLCPGIRLLTGAGWILPAPADFKIKTNGDRSSWEWTSSTLFKNGISGEDGYISAHSPSQTVPILDNPEKSLSSAIKIDTPWRLECSDDILLLQLPVPYNNEPRFTVQPGLIDPEYTHNLNVQLVWNVLNGEEWVTSGTPLVHYIPIPRSFMNASNFDVVVDSANDHDKERESAFHYIQRATVPGQEHDTLKFRLAKIKKVLNKYNTRRNK